MEKYLIPIIIFTIGILLVIIIECRTGVNNILSRSHKYFEKKKYLKAKKCYRKLIKLRPNNSNLLYGYGYLLDLLKEYTEAEIYLSKAIELDSNNYLVYSIRGHHYCLTGNYEKAENDLFLSIKLKDDYYEPYYNLACIASIKGDILTANRYLEKSLELGYNDFEHILKDESLHNIIDHKDTKEIINKFIKM